MQQCNIISKICTDIKIYLCKHTQIIHQRKITSYATKQYNFKVCTDTKVYLCKHTQIMHQRQITYYATKQYNFKSMPRHKNILMQTYTNYATKTKMVHFSLTKHQYDLKTCSNAVFNLTDHQCDAETCSNAVFSLTKHQYDLETCSNPVFDLTKH